MNDKKALLILSLLLAALALNACDLFEDKEAGKEEEARKAREQARLEREADQAGLALTAGFAHLFEASADELKLLNTAPAVNALGTVNGFFTNPQGISGYFQNFTKPFNFIWTGATERIKAFDGRSYQVMTGPGLMILKYMDDDLLLQRYEGETSRGLLHGYGEQWSRNPDLEGNHYIAYRGELSHDQMDGRGALSDYDFSGDGDHPYRYEGEFKDNLLHGQGRIFDLATGKMTVKGQWLAGQYFMGGDQQWREAAEEYESGAKTGVSEILMTDDVVVTGLSDAEEGGELVIWPVDNVENLKAVDQTGHEYAFGMINAPLTLDDGSEAAETEAYGSREKRPLSIYPLTLNLSYDREGQRHFLRFTVRRPQVALFGTGFVSEAEAQ